MMSMALGRLFGWVPSVGELRERLMEWREPGHWRDDYRNAVIMIAAAVPLVYSRIWFEQVHYPYRDSPFPRLPRVPDPVSSWLWGADAWAASVLSLIGIAIIVAAIGYIGGGRRFRHFRRGVLFAIGSVPLLCGQLALVAGLLLAYFEWQGLLPLYASARGGAPITFYPPPTLLIEYGLVAWVFGEAWLRLTSEEFEYVPQRKEHSDGDPDCPECARLRGILNRSEELLTGLQSENAQLRRRLEE